MTGYLTRFYNHRTNKLTNESLLWTACRGVLKLTKSVAFTTRDYIDSAVSYCGIRINDEPRAAGGEHQQKLLPGEHTKGRERESELERVSCCLSFQSVIDCVCLFTWTELDCRCWLLTQVRFTWVDVVVVVAVECGENSQSVRWCR